MITSDIKDIQQIATNFRKENIIPGYSDGDILMIDNIKNLFSKGPNTIRPFFNTIAICKNGNMQMEINGEPIEVQKNQIFVCPPEVVFDKIMISPDFEFFALCITNRWLQLSLRNHINEWNQILYVKKMRIFSLKEEESSIFEKASDFMNSIINNPSAESWKQNEIIRNFVSTGVLALCFILSDKIKESTSIITPKQNTSFFNQFLTLLQSTEHKHQPISYYSSILCISDKYLSEICKKNSGKTANDWIKEYTLTDITYYLKNTQLSIKEVCDKVGFPNTSFFGKYVKDAFGCSPGQYRNKLQQNE